MHEPLSWRVSRKSLSCRIALALGLASALFVGSSSALAQTQAPSIELKPAIMSLKASRTLLLDVAHAGDRLVAVGARGHIVYSDDNGATWLQATVPTRQLLTAVHFVDASHGWAVGHDSLVLHTADGGETWAVQYRDPELEQMDEGFGYLEKPLMDVWFRDADTGLAAGAYGLLLRTDDGGETWDDVSFDVDNEDGFHYNALAEIRDSGLFMVGEMGTMYRSADYGDTWETLENGPYDGSWFGVSATGEPGGVIAWGLRGNVFRSDDFGDTWQEVTLMTPNNGPLDSTLAGGGLTPDGRLVIVGVGGVVAISEDAGRSFNVRIRSDRVALASATALDGDDILLVGQRGAVTAGPDGAATSTDAVVVPVPATEE